MSSPILLSYHLPAEIKSAQQWLMHQCTMSWASSITRRSIPSACVGCQVQSSLWSSLGNIEPVSVGSWLLTAISGWLLDSGWHPVWNSYNCSAITNPVHQHLCRMMDFHCWHCWSLSLELDVSQCCSRLWDHCPPRRQGQTLPTLLQLSQRSHNSSTQAGTHCRITAHTENTVSKQPLHPQDLSNTCLTLIPPALTEPPLLQVTVTFTLPTSPKNIKIHLLESSQVSTNHFPARWYQCLLFK